MKDSLLSRTALHKARFREGHIRFHEVNDQGTDFFENFMLAVNPSLLLSFLDSCIPINTVYKLSKAKSGV